MTPKKAPVIHVSEKEVSKTIKEYLAVLEKLGLIVWWSRINSGTLSFGSRGKKTWVNLARAGTPDFLAMKKGGQFVAIEAKSSKGKLTDVQASVLNKIRVNGGLAIMARSVSDIERFFQ